MSPCGIEFIMKDGSKDHYDPVYYDDFLQDSSETHYIIRMFTCSYEIDKSIVDRVNQYPLCERCGRDARDNGCWRDDCELAKAKDSDAEV